MKKEVTIVDITKNGLFCDGDWIEKKDQDPNGDIRLIQLADIGDGYFIDKSQKFINKETANRLNCTFLEKGDILISRLGEPLGKACIFPYSGKYITAVDIAILRINNPEINANYVMRLINSVDFRNKITAYQSGTTRKRISRKNLGKIVFSLPEYSEQERIVARIEELFSELDKAVETLNVVEKQLELYKHSVINSYIKDDSMLSINDCLVSMGQGWSPKCDNTSIENDEEWAVIKTTAVQPMDFIFSENKKLPATLSPRKKHELEVGDVLITRAGPRSRCGICCVVKKTKKRLLNCDKVYRLKVNKNKIVSEYLEIVLNSPNFQKEIEFCKTGGNDSGLNLTQDRFLEIRIPVPTVTRQYEIINKLDEKLSVCNKIKKTVDTALVQAEAMRQSILKQAFEGGL